MIKEEIKEISTLSRSEIVHKNFFKELENKNISNTTYAKDNNPDKTTLSKWKSMTTTMSIEHVYQAANYLHVTVNDLYYSLAEKKKIQVLSNNPYYTPIKAKQNVKIKMYEEQFNSPFYLLKLILFIFVLLTTISFFACKSSGFWLFLLLGIPMAGYQYYKDEFSYEKTFIVDYLDDIYYKIDESKNQYFMINLLLHVVALLCVIISFVLLFQKKSFYDADLETMIIFLILGMGIYAIVNFFTLISHEPNLKNEIYDNEIISHTSSMVNLYMSLLLLAIGICFLYQHFVDYWYIVIFLLVSALFSLIEYLLTTKKYSEYKLVFKEQDKEEVALFINK